ncbi:MAG: hypothetical protein JSV74_05990 [Dehalococcoidia bacterium]|nr:MAG: hypothetical protein JSV74_05990 [Dehalococcoidia bacterium]
MARCHNCGRETMRTEDWACRWCGHPLPFGPFKKIDKTYRQLKEERFGKPIKELENIQQAETKLNYGETVALKQDSATIKRIKLEPEPEFKKATFVQKVEPNRTEEDNVTETEEFESESATEMPSELDVEENQAPENEPELEFEAEKELEEKSIVSTVPEIKDIPVQEPEIEQIQETEIEPVSPDMELNVEDILKEYEIDDAAADEMFMNKILRVTGIVSLIDIKDKLDIHYIRITGSGVDPWQNLQCMFDKKYASVLGELERGQTVTVQGRYSGSIIAIRMVNCELIS